MARAPPPTKPPPPAAAQKSTEDVSALVTAADALWLERVDEAKLREAIDAYAKVHAADPGNRHALLHLTRGWYFLGDSHLTDKQEKIDAWATAISYGKQCLALNSEFAQRVQNEKEKDAIEAATKDDAPCIYWLASALGKWGKIQGVAKVLGQLPTVKAYISTVEKLDPEYFHYGPARYWGAYYSASSFTSATMKSPKPTSPPASTAPPTTLPTRGLRAGQFAVLNKNYEMFKEDIQYILDFDATSYDSLVPENTLEQRKAKDLWDRRAELFDKDAIEAAGD